MLHTQTRLADTHGSTGSAAIEEVREEAHLDIRFVFIVDRKAKTKLQKQNLNEIPEK